MTARWRRYCKRGHDTWRTGRRNNSACRACNNERRRERAAALREQSALFVEVPPGWPHEVTCCIVECDLCMDRVASL